MPYIPHTPEALLARNDSKNPATTCKGITKSGRPCRRDVAASAGARRALPGARPFRGSVAIVSRTGTNEDLGAFFCWQHKDQAEGVVQRAARDGRQTRAEIVDLKARNSIDTLVERLGILDVEDLRQPDVRNERVQKQRLEDLRRKEEGWPKKPAPARKETKVHFNTVDVEPGSAPKPVRRQSHHKATRRKESSFWSSLCCMASTNDGDYYEVIRHKDRVRPHPGPSTTHRPHAPSNPSPRPRPQGPGNPSLSRPSQPATHHSDTASFLSLIPRSLPPQTTSALLTELAKPVSPFDEEGYIYIFQLSTLPTPSPSPLKPSPSPTTPTRHPSIAARLLSSPSSSANLPRSSANRPRVANAENPPSSASTLMLKIGRASNVQRRMNEWTRQCGYALELVRWYPYLSSSPHSSSMSTPTRKTVSSSSPSGAGRLDPHSGRMELHSGRMEPHSGRMELHSGRMEPNAPSRLRPDTATRGERSMSDSALVRKVPHSHRVERLIHLELAGKQVKRKCEVCGKEHREWFEVEATREGVKAVDEAVRRWVEWDERGGS